MNRRHLIRLLMGAGAAGGAGALLYEYYRPHRDGAMSHPAPVSADEHFPVQLVDVTHDAGISFQHNSGAFGKKYLPETLGAGCAFFDYDNDGWLDILLVNGTDWPEHKRQRATMQLYRHTRHATITDVTPAAGLDLEMYGIGVAVGDYDNDGFADLYITCYGQSRLFHNNGNGTFSEVTKRARLAGYTGLSTSALWFDYDRDGHLDLLVANYVRWSPESDIYCSLDGRTKSYCTPEAYA